MNDTISRREAIEAIQREARIAGGIVAIEYADMFEYVLKQLPSAEVTLCHLDSPCEYQNADIAMPSAQPEIIRCKDCKQFRRWIDTNTCFCDITESEISDNDFCSRAERRKG